MMNALGADSEEKHEPASNINTVVADSLKALDPEWPIKPTLDEPRLSWQGSATTEGDEGRN
jgi:hypothetical protein